MGPWSLPLMAAAVWAGVLMAPSLGAGRGLGRAAFLLASGVAGIGLWLFVPRSAGSFRWVRGASGRVLAGSVVLVSFAGLGAGWAGIREVRMARSPISVLAGRAVRVEGSVNDLPRPGEFGWTATVDVGVLWPGGGSARTGVKVSDPLWAEGHGPAPSLRPGDRVAMDGVLEAPGGPFGSWLRRRGYPGIIAVDRVRRVGPATDPLRRIANALHSALAGSVARMFAPREAGLLMGLALGDTSRLDPLVEEDFRATGLSHLTAVSGENLAMFLAPLMGLVGLAGTGRWARLCVGGLAIGFFILLAGAEPSVLRAAAMAGLTMLGVFLGRPRSPPAILGGAVLVLLVSNPTLVYSIGFQLSVAATAGMALLAKPIAERLPFLPESLALAAGTTIAAQAGVAPLLLYHFGLVPLVSLPANLLAFPAVAPAMLLGLVAAAVGTAVPVLGGGVALLARIPLRYLEGLAHRLAHWPLPSVTSPGGRVGQLVLGIGLIAALGWWVRIGARIPRRAVVAGLLVLPVVLWSAAIRAGSPGSLTVVFLDVGQGDAALIRSPAGANVLIDGGPDPELAARKLAALGVHRLDILVATHPHKDHVGGLSVVLIRFAVGLVLDPGCRGDAPSYADFLRAVSASGAPLRHPRPGAVFMAGDIRLEVLGPARCFHGTDSDPNNDSLVLRVRSGGATVLFPGDAEKQAQTFLVDHEGAGLVATVLKVPHHGGATSIERFFEAVHARVAVISVGPNTYGHPSAEVLEELAADGMRVFRTDRSGDVTVSFRGGDVLVDAGGVGSP